MVELLVIWPDSPLLLIKSQWSFYSFLWLVLVSFMKVKYTGMVPLKFDLIDFKNDITSSYGLVEFKICQYFPN